MSVSENLTNRIKARLADSRSDLAEDLGLLVDPLVRHPYRSALTAVTFAAVGLGFYIMSETALEAIVPPPSPTARPTYFYSNLRPSAESTPFPHYQSSRPKPTLTLAPTRTPTPTVDIFHKP